MRKGRKTCSKPVNLRAPLDSILQICPEEPESVNHEQPLRSRIDELKNPQPQRTESLPGEPSGVLGPCFHSNAPLIPLRSKYLEVDQFISRRRKTAQLAPTPAASGPVFFSGPLF